VIAQAGKLFAALFFIAAACGCNAKSAPQPPQPKDDLKTEAGIKAYWSSFLTALKTGNESEVRALCTEEGVKCILAAAGPNASPSDTFKRFGNSWTHYELKKIKVESNGESASATMGPEVKEHGLWFRFVGGKWLLDRWQPGM
jgi:hypothetical protein